MLPEVVELQTNAVEEIISQMEFKKEITFKAPTGSGKTYMMADLMDRVLAKNKDVVFLVSSLSKGNLAEQNFEKFVEYVEKGQFRNICPYLITSETTGENGLHIPTDYNVYILPRDLYKDKSKLKQGALINFLRALTCKIQTLGLNKKIYVVKDECHIATTNLDELADEYFAKVLNFSATPKLSRGQKPDVILDEIKAINAHLIKKINFQNLDEGIDIALDKYEEIKKLYLDNIDINPCIIIQISNKEKADEEVAEIKSILEKKHKDLKWMLIVNEDKNCDTNDVIKTKNIPITKWKDYAKTNHSTIDVIIFKMVITEGWDIPRACMLYQVRDSKSMQLDEQVIGRIRRNPRLLDFEKLSSENQELISTAYVWGMQDKEKCQIYEVQLAGNKYLNEIQDEIKLKTTRLKNITETCLFDIDEFLNNKKDSISTPDIFKLYREYKKTTNEVKEIYEKYVTTPQKWFKFTKNINDISKKSKDVLCDYEKNMEIIKDENENDVEISFPLISYYTDNVKYEGLGNWVWTRTDGKNDFSFDSEAEKDWARILIKLTNEDSPNNNGRLIKNIKLEEIIENEKELVNRYLVGKNFLVNSNIKYEYYLNGIHSSYPDFIMKDYKNRIHIFETKSLNKSAKIQVDSDDYQEKIKELIKAYKTASKLTGYYFYIPIKEEDKWKVHSIYKDEVKIFSEHEFIKFVRS